MVRKLLEAGVPAGKDYGWGPLLSAASNGHIFVMKILLEHGANPDLVHDSFTGTTPLHCAANYSGNTKAIQLLLDRGVDINRRDGIGNTPLHRAAANGHVHAIRYLLEKGASLELAESSEKTLLMVAARDGQLKVVKMLLKLETEGIDGIQKDKVNRNDYTALHYAAEAGHADVVDVLVTNGFDMEKVQGAGETPLMQAAWKGHTGVVAMLLGHGANVDFKHKHDGTALCKAAGGYQGRTEIVRLLLRNGASIEARNTCQQTPLYLAVQKGDRDTVELLLSKGADANAKTATGETPLAYAQMIKDEEIIALLSSAS